MSHGMYLNAAQNKQESVFKCVDESIPRVSGMFCFRSFVHFHRSPMQIWQLEWVYFHKRRKQTWRQEMEDGKQTSGERGSQKPSVMLVSSESEWNPLSDTMLFAAYCFLYYLQDGKIWLIKRMSLLSKMESCNCRFVNVWVAWIRNRCACAGHKWRRFLVCAASLFVSHVFRTTKSAKSSANGNSIISLFLSRPSHCLQPHLHAFPFLDPTGS